MSSSRSVPASEFARKPPRESASGGVARVGLAGTGASMSMLGKVSFIALITPVFFEVGNLLLTPSRLLFVFLIPVLLMRLFSGAFGRVNYIDWLVLFHVFWFSLSVVVNNPSVALTYAGVNSVILLGGYLAGRASIRNIDQFNGFIRFFAFVVTLAVPFAIYETLTQQLTIPLILEKIPGITSNKDVSYPLRMGLDRVQFVFVHPIHFGFFCSLSVGLFFVAMKNQVGNFRLWAQTAILGLMCFLSLSSGPFLSMIIQILLILWAHVMRKLENRWAILGWGLLVLYAILEIASNGPALYVIITKLAFNPGTANVRRILLDYGIDQVFRTPVFGIFQRPWNLPSWMTGSLDNYWLGLAVAFGFPTFFSQFAAFIGAMISIGRRPAPAGGDFARVRLAWILAMVSATLTLGTVFVWSEIASFMLFFFGAGIWMLDAKIEPDAPEPTTSPPPSGPRYTRFAQVRHRDSGGAAPRRDTERYRQ